MATNLHLDDRLVQAAQRAGKHRTKKKAVTVALEEYVKRARRLELVELFGTVDFDPSYDHRSERRRKRNP